MYHGIPPAGAKQFAAEMGFLKRHFSILPLDAAVQALRVQECRQTTVVLTFDDGLRNNYTVVYPILAGLGIPATFFVCPGLVELHQWLWNHEVRARLQRLPANRIAAVMGSFGGSPVDANEAVEWMKILPFTIRAQIEYRLREETSNFQPSDEERELYDLMTWDELRQLDPRVAAVGSHTVSHPVLPTLSQAECRREIVESRAMLEAKLDRTVDLFCYPNGAENSAVVDEVRRTYKCAVSTESGIAGPEADPFRLPRIPAPGDPSLLAWRLVRPNA